MVATLLRCSAGLPQVNLDLDLTALEAFLWQRDSARASTPSGPDVAGIILDPRLGGGGVRGGGGGGRGSLRQEGGNGVRLE